MNNDLTPRVPQDIQPTRTQQVQVVNQMEMDDEDVIDLYEYWLLIRRHLWAIIALAMTFAVLAMVYAWSLPSIYRATTTTMLETQQLNTVSIEQVYGLDSRSWTYLNSQIAVIESRKVAARVVDKLKLTTHKDLDPRQQVVSESRFSLNWRDWLPESMQAEKAEKAEPTEADIKESLTNWVAGGLSVKLQKDSQLVEISFEAEDPKLATAITIEVANAYITSGYEANLEVTQQAVGWLTERLSGLKVTLDESEQKLINYRNQEGLLDVAGVQTLSANEVDDLADKLSDTRRERLSIEATYEQIKAIKNPSVQDYESIPGFLDSPSVQSAKTLADAAEEKLIEVSKVYGKKHPRMVAARANYNKAYANYLRLLKNVAKGVERRYNAIQSNEASLKNELNRSKGDIREINKKSFKLRELERNVETNRQLYQTFFTRFKETSETSGMQTALARIIDKATVPVAPIKPRKRLIIMIAAILGLGLGVMLVFLKEALNKTIRTPEDVENKLAMPILGILPLLKIKTKDKVKPIMAFIDENKSNFAEAIRTIRTGVVLSGLDSQEKVAVITSSVPNEGKTTVAINLAIALGQNEKVLLIDADLRKPSIAKSCKIETKEGLSTLVAGSSSFEQCLHHFKDWGIDILPAGIIPPNPQELLGSKRFGMVIKALSKKYERIVIDTAPVQAVSDAQLIAVHSNEVIYVVKADATPYTLAANGIDKFKKINRNVIGVVLNQVNIDKAAKYYSGEYYSGYYQNYGYNN